MKEGEYFENMYRYIENLPEEDKVSSDMYESRLEQCKQCDMLAGGMCRECGCFVEMRAAMAVKHCPALEARW